MSFFLLISLLFFTFWTVSTDINFGKDPCPVVLGCKCANYSLLVVDCANIDDLVLKQLQQHYPNLETLRIATWEEDEIDLNQFEPFKRLKNLHIHSGTIEEIHLNRTLPKVQVLDISKNYLEDFGQVSQLLKYLPVLRSLNISANYLPWISFPKETPRSLAIIDLAKNQISNLESVPLSTIHLNISYNNLEHILNISTSNLVSLDASYNQISLWENATWPRLVFLDVSNLKLENNFSINAPNLRSMRTDGSSLVYLDFNQIRAPTLTSFRAKRSLSLEQVIGRLMTSVTEFSITKSKIQYLPSRFFEKSRKLVHLELESSKLDCSLCSLEWAVPAVDQLSKILAACNITKAELMSRNCTTTLTNNGTIHWGLYEKNSYLSCQFVGAVEPPLISWWRYRPARYFGKYDPVTDSVDLTNATNNDGTYEVLKGGVLLIKSATRKEVERYVCVGEFDGQKIHGIVKFRLDYSNWYSLDVFNSVFWGALAMSFFVCAVSFLLNITWILTRKSILWWIQRAERLSRVRKMVEALEKYRARQMESLHDKYTKRVQGVRDNYHQQVEALRVSYSQTSERFRDYGAAQMDAVSAQIENIRDNYNAQLGRVRDYGSKRAEQLWESYERQTNRMRTFSLQQRLKLMRQYKVKQRYLNKLLESFQANSPEEMMKHEEEVRAALELPAPPNIAEVEDDEDLRRMRLSRASSFHSLPEYVIDKNGEIRQTPLTPSANGQLDFDPLKRKSTAAKPQKKAGGDAGARARAQTTSPHGLMDLRDQDELDTTQSSSNNS